MENIVEVSGLSKLTVIKGVQLTLIVGAKDAFGTDFPACSSELEEQSEDSAFGGLSFFSASREEEALLFSENDRQ